MKCIIKIWALWIWNYVVCKSHLGLRLCVLALAVLKMFTVKKKLPVQHQGHILWHIGLVKTGAVAWLGDFSQRTSCQESIEINEKERKGHFVPLFVENWLSSRHAWNPNLPYRQTVKDRIVKNDGLSGGLTAKLWESRDQYLIFSLVSLKSILGSARKELLKFLLNC